MARIISTCRDLDSFNRQITLISVDQVSEMLPLPLRASPYFTMFLAMDADQQKIDALREIPRKLLSEGLVYLSTWGPGCGRVHDIVDLEAVNLETQTGTEYDVVTTWHEKESLDDALWSFLHVSWPEDKYADNCSSAFVVTVANREWSDHLAACLSDVESFDIRMLNLGSSQS